MQSKSKLHPTQSKLHNVLIIMLLLVSASLAYNQSQAGAILYLSELDPFDLTDAQRILVIAPHPDDETIGAGGLIQSALGQGSQVRVVVITNGDGQGLAPLALHRLLSPAPEDYIALGESRQQETLNALAELGLLPEDVVFLGYPDRLLMRLWLANWKKDCPIKSPYTRSTIIPYDLSYQPGAAYCGSTLVENLQAIMIDFQPDLVVMPHPNDQHADHRAGANFTRLALALLHESVPDVQPVAWGYITHYGYYPWPRGRSMAQSLTPPLPLFKNPDRWARLDLTLEEQQAKAAALSQHISQTILLGSFLPSFDRQNELFYALKATDLQVEPVRLNGPACQPGGINSSLVEPGRDRIERLIFGGADLVRWDVRCSEDTLSLTANVRGRLLPGTRYQIQVKLPTGETYLYDLRSPETDREAHAFTANIGLTNLGNPEVIGFSARVYRGFEFDHTGWYFLSWRAAP